MKKIAVSNNVFKIFNGLVFKKKMGVPGNALKFNFTDVVVYI